MKFSCDLNEINYLFEIIDGHRLSEKYKFMLSSKERKKVEAETMKYYTLKICAKKKDCELNFELQGIALSIVESEQIEEIEDYLENNLVFTKIEERIKQALTKTNRPIWGKK